MQETKAGLQVLTRTAGNKSTGVSVVAQSSCGGIALPISVDPLALPVRTLAWRALPLLTAQFPP